MIDNLLLNSPNMITICGLNKVGNSLLTACIAEKLLGKKFMDDKALYITDSISRKKDINNLDYTNDLALITKMINDYDLFETFLINNRYKLLIIDTNIDHFVDDRLIDNLNLLRQEVDIIIVIHSLNNNLISIIKEDIIRLSNLVIHISKIRYIFGFLNDCKFLPNRQLNIIKYRFNKTNSINAFFDFKNLKIRFNFGYIWNLLIRK